MTYNRRATVAIAFAAALTACSHIPPAVPTYTFSCADGYVVHAIFVNDSVVLETPDATFRMAHLISADGGRYGADSLIFWEKGTTAFIQRGDSTIHKDCVRRGAH